MDISKKQKSELLNGFASMQNLDDFVALLNKTQKYALSDYPGLKDFTKKQVNFYVYGQASHLDNNIAYKRFYIPKKGGGKREILAPRGKLLRIQRIMNVLLQILYKPTPAAHGFVPGRNVKTNAEPHVGKNYVLNADLKDFFPAIWFGRVLKVLQIPPFNLNEERGRLQLAFIWANLMCISYDTTIEGKQKRIGYLPQGAATSPMMSNFVARRLDKKLLRLAREYNASYTRYADDITFSANKAVFKQKFHERFREIVEQENFRLNPAKSRMQEKAYRQEVTGIIVNEKPNVNKRYIKRLRTMLHNWETKGYEIASEIFAEHYLKDKGHVSPVAPELANVILGKLQYLRMIKGEDDKVYQKYWQRFLALMPGADTTGELDNQRLQEILEVVETKGLSEAIDQFNDKL